jgi:hypothetical protein
MTIKITQTCDGCGTERELKSLGSADNEGWREVSTHKHLCAACITKAIEGAGTKE